MAIIHWLGDGPGVNALANSKLKARQLRLSAQDLLLKALELTLGTAMLVHSLPLQGQQPTFNVLDAEYLLNHHLQDEVLDSLTLQQRALRRLDAVFVPQGA